MINLIKFRGAKEHFDDDGNKTYEEREPFWANEAAVQGVYDHTIVIVGRNIKVMETEEEIVKKLGECQ